MFKNPQKINTIIVEDRLQRVKWIRKEISDYTITWARKKVSGYTTTWYRTNKIKLSDYYIEI